MDDRSFEMLNDRIDRLESKIDKVLEQKWKWIGQVNMITFLASIAVSFFIKWKINK